MNLSNPKPIKVNLQKDNILVAIVKKLWAFIGMLSLMAPGPTTKDTITSKNIGVLIFILLITYSIICGIWQNVQWLKHITISGEWFYHIGIAIIIFTCIEFFNLEKKVREFAFEKKIIIANKNSMLENVIGRHKLYNVISLLMEAISLLWVIMGIIFYDRNLFILLLSISILLIMTSRAFKKIEVARKIFMIESIISITILLFILLNHFLNH